MKRLRKVHERRIRAHQADNHKARRHWLKLGVAQGYTAECTEINEKTGEKSWILTRSVTLPLRVPPLPAAPITYDYDHEDFDPHDYDDYPRDDEEDYMEGLCPDCAQELCLRCNQCRTPACEAEGCDCS